MSEDWSRSFKALLSRREMLFALGATAALPALPGCRHKAPPANPTVFDTFRSLRDIIRTSPDHLAARAAQVIASKDFTAAVRFVRDNIAVLPPRLSSDAAIDGVRWGPDATLRAGGGTQRERQELLKAMLVAMGATARILDAPRPSSIDATALYRTRPPSFAIDPAELQSLGPTAAAQAAHINDPFPDPDPSAVIASLNALIPAGMAVTQSPFDGLDSPVPIVEYTANGTTKWAFAIGAIDEVTTAPAGLNTLELSPASYPSVSVRLLASIGDVPGVPTAPGLVELAAGKWTADQVAGSRILITTSSSDPDASIGAPPDQVTIRTPLIQVRRSTPLTGSGDPALWSPSTGTPAPAPAIGGPITLSGAQIALPANPGDPVVGPYGTVTPLDAAAHASALASVASVQAAANPGAFPQVQLTVAALDGSGNPVSGLVASDFAITDEGNGQAVSLLSNAGVPQIKVLLSYDCDATTTDLTPAAKSAFESTLANACLGATANPYLLGVAVLGAAPLSGYVAPNLATIQNDIAACNFYTLVWDTVGNEVPAEGASAVVMVSDFFADDDPTLIPSLQQRAASLGIPLALVPVAPFNQPVIDQLVQTCGAVVIDPTAANFQQQITDFINNATQHAKTAGYRFSYRIPDTQLTNQGTRTAAVSLAARSGVATSTPYVVPPANVRGNAGFAGLYLELTVGVAPVVTRRLSGPPLNRFGAPTQAVASDFDDTRTLLDGIVTIALEPGSPTAAQNAEDFIGGVLSLEPVKAVEGKTMSDALQALGGVQFYPAALSVLVAPPPPAAGTPIVAPDYLRVVVSTHLATGSGQAVTTDIVTELNHAVAATLDPAASFQAAMRSGVVLGLREGVAMTTSAAGALSAVPLQYLAPGGSPASLTGFAAADLAKWQPLFDEFGNSHLLIPTNPSAGAMWVVDRYTGSTMAVSVDGRGFGGNSNNCLSAAANLAAQTALMFLQIGIARILLECKPGGSISCDGANVFGVGASVLGIFAGLTFDQDETPDEVIFLGGWLLNKMTGGGAGPFWGLLGVMISMTLTGLSVTECK